MRIIITVTGTKELSREQIQLGILSAIDRIQAGETVGEVWAPGETTTDPLIKIGAFKVSK